MLKKALCALGTYFSLLSFVGCSIDSAQIIEHPASAKPGDTINVSLGNMYAYVTNSRTIPLFFGTQRDSLHVGLGLPSGWSVVSVDYYAATHWKIAKSMDGITDTVQLIKDMHDSLQAFKNRKVSMVKDPGLMTALLGREYDAHDSTSDSTILISTDSIDQWFTYSSRLGINLPAGTVMDTFFVLADSLKDSLGTGTEIDTVGMKVVPIFVFAKVKTGPAQGNFPLFYFTKTDKMPVSKIDTSLSGDVGDMVFYNFTNSTNTFVKSSLASSLNQHKLQIYPNPFVSSTNISIGAVNQNTKLAIYSLDGAIVKMFDPKSIVNGSILWDGKSQNGFQLKSGTYVIRVNKEGLTKSEMVKLIK